MQEIIMDADFWLKFIAIIGTLLAMLYGTKGVFDRLKDKQQGFGPNSLQALAVDFFLPSLVLVSILTKFDSAALAALLGTVAGYILSSPKNDEK